MAARDFGAKCPKCQFAVVACTDVLKHFCFACGLQPASSTHVLTCALGTGDVNSIERKLRPSIVSGAWPSVSVSRAPMAINGICMRPIGRLVSEASPISVNSPSCAASKPLNIRIVEPELPQSSGSALGVTRPPTPVTSIAPGPIFFTVAPSCCMQLNVDAQSAPVEKFEKRDVPWANAPSMAYL